MSKKNKKTLIIVVSIILVLCIGIIVFFSVQNHMNVSKKNELENLEASQMEDVETDTNPSTEAQKVIVDNTATSPTTKEAEAVSSDILEAKDVVRREENGVEIQSPNWEKQKELTDESDIKDKDTVPEYKVNQAREEQAEKAKSSSSGQNTSPSQNNNTPLAGSGNSSGGTETQKPAQPTEKHENGKYYVWLDGFGWVETKPSVSNHFETETTGNQVGH